MVDLHMDDMILRYRASPLSEWRSPDLNQVLNRMLDTELDRALLRFGIPEDEEICIREINVVLRLNMALSSEMLAAECSRSIAKRIDETVQRRDIVRFASRRDALLDLGLSAVAGDSSRAWAWEMLGFGSMPIKAESRVIALRFYEALMNEPPAIIPLLKEIGRRKQLSGLIPLLKGTEWSSLAKRALERFGVTVRGELVKAGDEPQDFAVPKAFVRRLELGLDRSVIASALTGNRLTPGGAAEEAVALTTFAILETDPAFLRIHNDQIQPTLKVAAAFVRKPRSQDVAGKTFTGQGIAAEASEPQPAHTPQQADERERVCGRTNWGGLLFLLTIIEKCGLSDDLDDMSTALDRPIQWILHQIALRLVPVTIDDPAARAFAGLDPQDALPADERVAPNCNAGRQIAVACNRIVRTLSELIPHMGEPRKWLLKSVCYRRAVIFFDPGWIDVHMAHDTVSTDIRRAGLDLNPGYLAWMGCTVRFVYYGARPFSMEGGNGA